MSNGEIPGSELDELVLELFKTCEQCGQGPFVVFVPTAVLPREMVLDIYPDLLRGVIKKAQQQTGNPHVTVAVSRDLYDTILDPLEMREGDVKEVEKTDRSETQRIKIELADLAMNFLGQNPIPRTEWSSDQTDYILFNDYIVKEGDFMVASLDGERIKVINLPYTSVEGRDKYSDPAQEDAIQWLQTKVDQRRIGKITFNAGEKSQTQALVVWTTKDTGAI